MGWKNLRVQDLRMWWGDDKALTIILFLLRSSSNNLYIDIDEWYKRWCMAPPDICKNTTLNSLYYISVGEEIGL